MSVCEHSLRKLNGAHFICNWMEIKIPLMRGLKSWKGRLHAVNLRIWIMLEYAVPFYSLFLSFATPAKWINHSLPPSWKVKGKDSTTADEEHLSHLQSVDWSCLVQNLKSRDVSRSMGLGAGTTSLRPCVSLGRQPCHILSGCRKAQDLPLNSAVKRETVLGNTFLVLHVGLGSEENIPNLPCALRNKMSCLEAMSEQKQLEEISLGFSSLSVDHKKRFCAFLCPALWMQTGRSLPCFPHTQKCL